MVKVKCLKEVTSCGGTKLLSSTLRNFGESLCLEGHLPEKVSLLATIMHDRDRELL